MWNMALSWIMSFQSSLLSSSRKYALHASIDSREILLKSSSLSSKCRPNARFSDPVGIIYRCKSQEHNDPASHYLNAHVLAALADINGLVVKFEAFDNAQIDKLRSRRICIYGSRVSLTDQDVVKSVPPSSPRSLALTVMIEPVRTIPSSMRTPITIGSFALKMQSGRILSRHGKTAMCLNFSFCCCLYSSM